MRTEISELGEFGLIDRLTSGLQTGPATVKGVGDDAAVIDTGGADLTLLSTDMMLEGVDFDLTYVPLAMLGDKVVVRAASDILAMNGRPTQITIALGVSAKLSVEDLEELYRGIRGACERLGCDLAGGDTTASVTGLAIAATALGRVPREKISYRGGARENDLICITGDLGAAYLGLHLLEREKRSLAGVDDPQPQFEGYAYPLERQLRPAARLDVIESLAAEAIVPTAMIDLSDGLASDLMQICKASECGARIYLDRLPIARESYALADELHIDPVVAALNGGDDHELLLTIPLDLREQAPALGLEIIGHITPASSGAALVTPDGSEIPLRAQGFNL